MFSRGFEKKGTQFTSCPHCGLKGLYTNTKDVLNCKYCHLTGKIKVKMGRRSQSWSSTSIPEFTRD